MSDPQSDTEPPAPCNCVDGCGQTRPGPFGERSKALAEDERQSQCFGLALKYVGASEESVLLHGRAPCVASPPAVGLVMSDHAWVVESDGWTWEPVSDRWYHDHPAYVEASGAKPIKCYSAGDAAAMYAKHENFGPWESLS